MLEAVERKATHQTPFQLLRNMLARIYLAQYQGGTGKVPGAFGAAAKEIPNHWASRSIFQKAWIRETSLLSTKWRTEIIQFT